MANRIDDHRWFKTLDWAFWIVWLTLPVMIGLSAYSLLDLGEPIPGMTDEQARCLKTLPTIGALSAVGQTIIWTLFAFSVSIYVVLLAFLHGMVRRFAQQRIFVAETLGSLWWMGVILIVWPFLETGAGALASYLLKATGEVQFSVFRFNLDVAPIAVGLFLLATEHVIRRAMTLKEDADLTI